MSEKAVIIDTVSTALTYIGKAATKQTESSPFWSIRRLSTTGGVLKIEWADGDEEYDNIWTNRASLTYL